jgi:crotonobetainyl-CoA:carnitine CoA-transferase CaiB-like acyl-CoA transferase
MSGVLASVRVLDFGRYIAGPFCGALLGDLGADVIRIERPEGAEDRFLFPQTPQGDGATFLAYNRSKRGMTLDLKHPDAQDVLRRLIASADVVIANLPPAAMERMGLDYNHISSINPGVILANISAFGTHGPYKDRIGFDAVAQSMSGAAFMSGFDDHPTKSYANWVDVTTAVFSAFGVMGALRARDLSGRGQEVCTNLFRSSLTVVNSMLVEQSVAQSNRKASGNRGQTGAPVDTLRTQDGWITVQVLGNSLFRRVAEMLGKPQWLDDPRFADDTVRAANGEVVSEAMAQWCAGLTTAEAMKNLAAARIPAGPVLTPQQALDDPHALAANLFDFLDYPGAPRPVPTVRPVEMPASSASVVTRPPLLGEHTDEILADLGYDQTEIEKLRLSGAV